MNKTEALNNLVLERAGLKDIELSAASTEDLEFLEKYSIALIELANEIIQAERNGCAKRVGIVMDKKSTTHVDCYIREPIMEAIRDKQ